MVNERDGLRGLVVLTGAMFCQVILGGMSLSSGIFYVMYREAFNSSPVVTSWLCSLPLTAWFMSGELLYISYMLCPGFFQRCYYLACLAYAINRFINDPVIFLWTAISCTPDKGI